MSRFSADLHKMSKKGEVKPLSRMGHPVLHEPAKTVDIQDPACLQAMRDIAATVVNLERVGGLAAPQVFIPLKIFYYDRSKGESIKKVDFDENSEHVFLINPQFEPIGDEIESDWEACFSVPDLVGFVPRPAKIRFTAIQSDGEKFEPLDKIYEGFHARILQHETDHVNGILYTHRMTDFTKLFCLEEAREFQIKSGRYNSKK